MQLPVIHLNGTSPEALYEQAVEAARAAYKLLEALSNASPNGRDYYPEGPEAFKKARKEHEDRILAVQRVRDEMMVLAEHAADRM